METSTNSKCTKRKWPRRHGFSSPRARTNSHSSVDYQMKEEDPVNELTSKTQTTDNVAHFLPGKEFLNILRQVDAQGRQSPHGEVFTLKQLGFYLREYIKAKVLYDPENPSIVHCKKDPLGKVFGRESFTVSDAPRLLLENAKAVNCDIRTWKTGEIVLRQGKERENHFMSQDASTELALTSIEHGDAVVTSTVPALSTRTTFDPKTHLAAALAEAGNAYEGKQYPASPDSNSHSSGSNTNSRHKKRAKLEKSISSTAIDAPTTSEAPDDSQRSRRRGSSFSIVLPSESEGKSSATPWYFMTVEMAESDESEVLSVQSKETMLVRDTSDDYWFLDVDDSDVVSVAMDQESISVEFQSAHSFSDPPFAEEYEVDSNQESERTSDHDEDDEDSPEEEGFIILCGDSDVEFWADSESSRSESDIESDESVAEADMWSCEQCDTVNSPLQRHCARCWTLRPDWLGDDISAIQIQGGPVRSRDQLTSSGSEAVEQERLRRRRPNRSQPRQRAAHNSPLTLQRSTLQPKISSDDNSQLRHLTGTRIRRWRKQPSASAASSAAPDKTVSEEESCARTQAILVEEPSISTPNNLRSPSAINKELSGFQETPIRTCTNWSSRTTGTGDSGLGSSQGSAGYSSQCGLVEEPECDLQDSGHFSNLCDKELDICDTNKDDDEKKSNTMPDPPATQTSNNPPCVQEGESNSNSVQQVAQSDGKSAPYSDLCMVCYARRKEASIIHGKTGHQVCCYRCAKKLWRRGKRCPVCRRPIQKIIKNFII